MKKFVVLCPADTVTGGPELLHQFVDALNKQGQEASILYYPFTGQHSTPEAYKKYNINISTKHCCKDKDIILISPEVSTNLLSQFKTKNKFIWWLSVDNYKILPFKYGINRLFRYYIKRKPSHLFTCEMKSLHHLVQSQYAKDYLIENGINKISFITDYLNEEHLQKTINLSNKKNMVAYNPKKGYDYTKKIIDNNPDIEFIPIENMTAKEVGKLLEICKVYIDFGGHPGKDRIPREAAMANCVIITGVKGSARNSIDVPIQEQYKFTETPENLAYIGNLISDIFNNFLNHNSHFDEYRKIISQEKTLFNQQVKEFINLITE